MSASRPQWTMRWNSPCNWRSTGLTMMRAGPVRMLFLTSAMTKPERAPPGVPPAAWRRGRRATATVLGQQAARSTSTATTTSCVGFATWEPAAASQSGITSGCSCSPRRRTAGCGFSPTRWSRLRVGRPRRPPGVGSRRNGCGRAMDDGLTSSCPAFGLPFRPTFISCRSMDAWASAAKVRPKETLPPADVNLPCGRAWWLWETSTPGNSSLIIFIRKHVSRRRRRIRSLSGRANWPSQKRSREERHV